MGNREKGETEIRGAIGSIIGHASHSLREDDISSVKSTYIYDIERLKTFLTWPAFFPFLNNKTMYNINMDVLLSLRLV